MEIHTLSLEYLNSVIELDKKITGEDHSDFFEQHFHSVMSKSENDLMIGATDHERLLGFLFASIRQVAFGHHSKIAFLEMIEVDPEFQKMGIGSILFKEFENRIKKLGVSRVMTIVDWKMTHLLDFFHVHGFRHGGMIQLELAIDDFVEPSEQS